MPPKASGSDPTAAAAAKLMQNPQFMAMFQKALGDGGDIPDEKDPNRAKWLKDMQEKLEKEQMEEQKKKLETPVTDEDGQWMYIMPEPGFCVKCTTLGAKKEKVFINICKHSRIMEPMPMDPSEFSEEEAEDMKESIRFRVPLSCSQAKPDVDKSGQPCRVYDVVVNTATIQRCSEDSEFRRFVVALSMSWIQQKYENTLNADQFTNLNFKAKGQLQIQRIHLRKPGDAPGATNAMNDEIQLPKTAQTATVPQAPASSAKRKMVQEVDPSSSSTAAAAPAPAATSTTPGSGSSGLAAALSGAAGNNSNTKNASSSSSNNKTPKFIVSKVGSYDWSKHEKPTKNPYFHETVPEAVAVEVTLENTASIKEVDVRIAKAQLELRWIDAVDEDEDCDPFLVVPVGFPVDDEPTAAKFSRKSKTLTIVLKVALPNEVEREEERARRLEAERKQEEEQELSKKQQDEKARAERRAKFDRMEAEEKAVMQERKEYVENIRAVSEGAVPPMLQQEIDKMPAEQAKVMLMRLEQKKRNNDGIDDMLDKLPDDALFGVCNSLRKKLGLELQKPPEPPKQPEPPVAAADTASPSPADTSSPQEPEYNFAKKSENLFGVQFYNRYTFALDH